MILFINVLSCLSLVSKFFNGCQYIYACAIIYICVYAQLLNYLYTQLHINNILNKCQGNNK